MKFCVVIRMRAFVRGSIFIALVILLQSTPLCAQWKKLAANVVKEDYEPIIAVNDPNYHPPFGAIHFKNGVLWAGWLDLWSSLDSGKTWQKNNLSIPGDVITDINFYDKMHGLVSTVNGRVYLTRNGGMNWNAVLYSTFNVPTTECVNVAFDGSPTLIHALCVGSYPSPSGELFTSFDGGGSWTPTDPGGPYGAFCQSFCITKDGSLYVLCSHDPTAGLPGFVSVSTDHGLTWQQHQQSEVDGESYTISADSCDPRLLYVANEDYKSTVNGLSDLYYSSDAGINWTSTASFPVTYLSGGMTTSLHAIYATSLASGIYRSRDQGKSWKNIGPGNDSIPSAYDSRNITCANDNIVFVLDSEGSVWGTTNSGGDSIPVPPTKDFILFSRDTLFAGESVGICDSASGFISFIRVGCPLPLISAMNILGNGASSYTPIAAFKDSLGVIFKPGSVGIQDAQLILTLSNGTFDTIILKGAGTSVPEVFTLSRDSLFVKDFFVLCDSFPVSHFVAFSHSGCPPPDITKTDLIGPAAQNFSVIPAAGDSLGVSFKPNGYGEQDADLILTLSNGTFDTLRLRAFISKIPYTLSFAPDTLFKLDSAFTCDSVTGKQIKIKATGCPLPKVNGKTITGNDASSFELISAPDTLTGSDNVIVTFKPTKTGKLNANVILTLDDGTTLTLPITGYGMPAIPISLSTQDQTTDTLGGTVQVPITISGLQKSEAVSLIVHYDTLLKYIGSFSLSNAQLDVANQQWKGRSEILIPSANPSGISAYAFFDVFNDTLPKQSVWFDSVTVTSAIPPCRYNFAPLNVTLSIINALTGCGTTTLSRFIHYGEMPEFALKPNPTGGNILLTSSEDIGTTEIIIYDMLGAEKGRSHIELKKDVPVRIELTLANGMYDVRIKTLSGVFDERVVVSR